VDLIHPHTKADVADVLREATAHGTRVLIVGGRTHMDRGNPCEVDAEMWITQLDQVVAYEPAEMLAVVEAGMRCGEFAALLAEQGQEWPVDAPHDATVGGVIAAGVSSPRRSRVGHVRDTVVEMELVTGDGRLIHSGARTVKNVTGYDVHRLLTGSLGTLGAIVQVGVKVRPLPESALTLHADGPGMEIGARLHGAVPSAAAIVAAPGNVRIRLEGWAGEVESQAAAASAEAPLSTEEGAEPFAVPGPEGTSVIEAAVPASRLSEMVADAGDWRSLVGVGIAWIGANGPQELATVRARASALGGIAPVVRGPGGLGESPIPGAAIHARLRSAFDPAGILAPGRFWTGEGSGPDS
jgi:glycolate oxidase FAD binding subunit